MIDFSIDFASKTEPKIEPEIDKIKALTQLCAQMAPKKATNLHFDSIMNPLIRFYEGFWTILDDLSTIFQSNMPKSNENPACHVSS